MHGPLELGSEVSSNVTLNNVVKFIVASDKSKYDLCTHIAEIDVPLQISTLRQRGHSYGNQERKGRNLEKRHRINDRIN